MQSWNSCGHFPFLGGFDPAEAPVPGYGLPANNERDVRAVVVVSPESLRGVILGLPLADRRLSEIAVRLDAFDDLLVQQFMPDCAAVALDASILLGLSGLDVHDGNPLFLEHFISFSLLYFGPLSTLIVLGLPRHSMIQFGQRITRSAGREKFTSIPIPSRLKSSSTFGRRNARPSPSRSAMKSIDPLPGGACLHAREGVRFGRSGTASASGLSRFNRLRGLMRRFSSGSQ